MKVLVGHTHPPTVAYVDLVLRQERIVAEFHELQEPEAYWHMFWHAWEQGEGFVNVEHDIIPWPGALTRLWGCTRDWCYYPYLVSGGYFRQVMLGCVKFSSQLIADTPELWSQITPTWRTLDTQLEYELLSAGYVPHMHWPPVAHLNMSALTWDDATRAELDTRAPE